MRIVSICPSNTELIAYLDLIPSLVGVDDFSDWPSSIKGLPRLGPDLSIRMDEVEALKPDLVLASLSVPGMERNIEELEKRKIPHIVLNPQSFADIARDLETVAIACKVEDHGKSISSLFLHQVQKLKHLSGKLEIAKPPSLYWEWWPKPVFTPGQINWLTEMSRIVGAENIFSDVELASVQTDWEDVRKRDPDYICLAWVGGQTKKVKPEILWKRPGWNEMSALKQQKVFILEESLYCRPSPRLLEGAMALGSLLFPTIFENLTLPKEFQIE
jgi:iron complex transport system substrate-binding protein